MKEKQVGITAKKENFSEWYPQVIQKADLADYSEVSGCIVFKPNSYAIWERIVAEVDKRIKKEFPHKFDVKTSKPQQRVASAARADTNVSGGKKQVRLSPSEVQMAKKLNVPLSEYAKFVKR